MATKQGLKLPNKAAAPKPRLTMPPRPGAGDLDAVMSSRANKVQKPKSNIPPGRQTRR